MSDTIAAVATGGGVSAIGIVRVSGPLSVSLMDALFRPADGKAMSQHRDRQLVYGKLLDEKGRTLDLCLCTLSRAPRSYTGEDTAELQCHGSPVVLRAALEALFALGARQARLALPVRAGYRFFMLSHSCPQFKMRMAVDIWRMPMMFEPRVICSPL